MKMYFAAVGVVAVALAIGGCAQQTVSPGTSGTPAENQNRNISQTPRTVPTPSPAAPPAAVVAPTPASRTVEINNFSFNPAELRIKIGDEVTWKNLDAAGHTITSDTGNELESATISTGAVYAHRFTAGGTFDYHCAVHPSMKGRVIVE